MALPVTETWASPAPGAAGSFPAHPVQTFPSVAWCPFAQAVCFGKSLAKEK